MHFKNESTKHACFHVNFPCSAYLYPPVHHNGKGSTDYQERLTRTVLAPTKARACSHQDHVALMGLKVASQGASLSENFQLSSLTPHEYANETAVIHMHAISYHRENQALIQLLLTGSWIRMRLPQHLRRAMFYEVWLIIHILQN